MGYLGSIGFAVIYIIFAAAQKILFSSNYLIEIDGFYIALMVIAVGGIVTVTSQFFMDKE